MFEALLGNALNDLTVAEELVGVLETYATSRESEEEKRVKQYANAACVMRVYAVYERFVETAIADYLDGIPELIAYADLPAGLRKEYRDGISHVLSRLDSRYSHLNHENVIRWYHNALAGEKEYRLVTEALTRHEQNLRLNTLSSLLSRIDVDSPSEWLAHCPHLAKLYEDDTRVLERLEAELKEFIDVRNDAAHGLLETLQAPNILLRHIEVIRAVVMSVAACLRAAHVQLKLDAQRSREIGRVTEILPKARAAIVVLDAGAQVAVGDTLYFRGRSFCIQQKVQSLRVENVSIQTFGPTEAATELGVGLDHLPRENVVVIGSVPPTA